MSQAGNGRELVAALKRAEDDDKAPKEVPAVAILWTWLEDHLPALGAHLMKSPEIANAARAKPTFEGITTEVWNSLEGSDPVLAAAELLAWIGAHIGRGWPLMVEARGFRDEEVLVSLRASEFVKKASGAWRPPSAQEHPSLTTLAPALSVDPVFLKGGVSLRGRQANSQLWEAALKPLGEQLTERNPKIQVHLDTLGAHGLTGWEQPEGELRGHFGDIVDKADGAACEKAAREAIRSASVPGYATILVIPELGVDGLALAAIKDELRNQEEARPCLTAVGLRHLPAEDEDPALAPWVNEAVLLAPNGTELLRHRKLMYAGSRDRMGEYDPFVEDIRPGDTLTIVATPTGNFSLVICLDSFGNQGRERLAHSPANVILVPSLSKSAKPHRVSLAHLVNKQWAIAFVCNRSPLLSEGSNLWNGDEARSFWATAHLGSIVPPARPDPEKDHPSFVFDLADPRLKKGEEEGSVVK